MTIRQQHRRLYKIWQNLRQRCDNPRNKDYPSYGGRGIKVCDEWEHDFIPFMLWALGNKYADDLSIDRIDVDGDYCPSNCRWATTTTQMRNRRLLRTNSTGVNGVYKVSDRGTYRAFIYVNNRKVDLGTYKTMEEAKTARKIGEGIYWAMGGEV